MQSRLPPSFAQRLIRYGLSIAVPVLLLCGALVYQYSVERYGTMEAETLAAARELKNDLDNDFDSIFLLLSTLSGILGPEMDLARLHRNATETLVPRGMHVMVHDVSGWPILNSGVPFGSPLATTSSAAGIGTVIESNSPYVSNLIDDPILGDKIWVVSAPLERNGRVAGVISITQRPAALAELLRKGFPRPAGWRWGVCDRDGILVAHSHEAARFVGSKLSDELLAASRGRHGVGWVTSLDGTQVLRGFARSVKSDWLVAVAVPASVVEKPLRRAWLLLAFGSALLVALALVLAMASARALHGNVDTLVDAAERLGRGERLADEPYSTREFQNIHHALVSAAFERRSSEERRQLLLRELQHRTNNLLAVVSSIVRRTLVEGRSLPEARETLMGRLQALANASDTLAAANWQGADIGRVIDNEMQPFAGRYVARGPKVLLSAQAAQNTSLVIHELATNASKHGALSVPSGQVAINWHVEGERDDPFLLFEWIERGGPPAAPPARRGFGYTLLETVLTDHSRKPEITFEASGLIYRTTVKLATIVASGSVASMARAQREQPASQSLDAPLRRTA
jgi:two-component sensor histidine kinase